MCLASSCSRAAAAQYTSNSKLETPKTSRVNRNGAKQHINRINAESSLINSIPNADSFQLIQAFRRTTPRDILAITLLSIRFASIRFEGHVRLASCPGMELSLRACRHFRHSSRPPRRALNLGVAAFHFAQQHAKHAVQWRSYRHCA